MRTLLFFGAAALAGCGGATARSGSAHVEDAGPVAADGSAAAAEAEDAGLVAADGSAAAGSTPSPVPSCVPGRSVSCACTNGAIGAQLCATNGSYGDCVCTGTGVVGIGGAGVPEGGPTPEGGAEQCVLPAEAAGRWIAFDSTFGGYNRDLYLTRADGSGLERLTTEASTEKEPAFSNDGRWLAFTSDRNGTMQIYLMDLLTYGITQLTSLSAGADEPSWSPDDSEIAFHSGASLYVVGMDGSDPRVVSSSSAPYGAFEYPVFTRDGKGLVFDGDNQIDTLLLDGTGFRYVIQPTTTTIVAPTVSPDSVNVAFSYVPGGAQVIAVAPLAATSSVFSSQTIISGSMGSVRRPAWGTSTVIAFEDGQVVSSWETVEASIALSTGPGSAPCQLANGQTDSRNPAWAPVGFQPMR